ncbi:MAG: Hsp70 family protein, partial [Ruminococcus sp.]|nr:Hsp70 family protein [Ruminococcus sp.]
EKAVAEAEKYAAEDKKRRETVDEKNAAENMAYAAEKLIKENGDKIDSADKSEMETKAANVRDAIKTDDFDKIKAAREDLEKCVQGVSTKLYQAGAAAQAANAQPTGTADGAPNTNDDGGNVYDADFKDVD